MRPQISQVNQAADARTNTSPIQSKRKIIESNQTRALGRSIGTITPHPKT